MSQRTCLILSCRFCLHFSHDNCCFNVIPHIEDEDMLITNTLASEAKLVRVANTHDKEHSVGFVLKTSALFKGLGEGKKAEF